MCGFLKPDDFKCKIYRCIGWIREIAFKNIKPPPHSFFVVLLLKKEEKIAALSPPEI